MVKAILEGRKTQTRRIIKQKYKNADIQWFTNKYGTRLIYRQNDADEPITMPDGTTRRKLVAIEEIKQPFNVGDILYVRETWQRVWDPEWEFYNKRLEDMIENYGSIYKVETDTWGHEGKAYYVYKADDIKFKDEEYSLNWRPSIHMPKEAARIFLKVTNIRVQRIHDITEDEAKAEGTDIEVQKNGGLVSEGFYKSRFSMLWNKIYNNWSENPWVWVIEFDKVKK